MKSSRYDSDSDGAYSSASDSVDHEQQSGGDDAGSAGPEALRRLQRKLTTAMEHMERAQLEFFHVERAFQDHKQQQQEQKQEDSKSSRLRDDQSVSWSVKVQLYCEFWQQFLEQLRSALHGDEEGAYNEEEGNERSIQALSMLASNVWGESRASPQEVFSNGPIVLLPGLKVRTPRRRESRASPQQAKSSSTMVFSGLGPHQDASRWIPAANRPMQSIRSLMTRPVASAKVSSTNDKAAAYDATRSRKKVKSPANKESAASAGYSAARGIVDEARQRVASSDSQSDNGFQSVPARPGYAEHSTSAVASQSAETTPTKIRKASPDTRKSANIIGYLDRLLADRGHPAAPATQARLDGLNSSSSAPRPQQQPRKKGRFMARKDVPAGFEDDEKTEDESAWGLRPVPSTTSDFSESVLCIKKEIAENGNSSQPTKPKLIGAARYRFNERLRLRIEDQLGANEVFPDIHIPFPSDHLMFDPNEYPVLAQSHKAFWQTNVAVYLDMVFYHPPVGGLKRISTGKMTMLRRQRALLDQYIKTLGIEFVARKFQAPDANIPFFFVKLINSLHMLSSAQLAEHLEYLKEPWRSPITAAHGISWWEALVCRKNGNSVKQRLVVDVSDNTKQQIASAHSRGELNFDATWLRLSTEPHWKEMLNQQRGMRAAANAATTTMTSASYDDEHRYDLPQSPPHRKKVAGKVPMNRESMRANGESAERASWVQQTSSLKANKDDEHEYSFSSSSSEDGDDGDYSFKPGKRLRTN